MVDEQHLTDDGEEHESMDGAGSDDEDEGQHGLQEHANGVETGDEGEHNDEREDAGEEQARGDRVHNTIELYEDVLYELKDRLDDDESDESALPVVGITEVLDKTAGLKEDAQRYAVCLEIETHSLLGLWGGFGASDDLVRRLEREYTPRIHQRRAELGLRKVPRKRYSQYSKPSAPASVAEADRAVKTFFRDVMPKFSGLAARGIIDYTICVRHIYKDNVLYTGESPRLEGFHVMAGTRQVVAAHSTLTQHQQKVTNLAALKGVTIDDLTLHELRAACATMLKIAAPSRRSVCPFSTPPTAARKAPARAAVAPSGTEPSARTPAVPASRAAAMPPDAEPSATAPGAELAAAAPSLDAPGAAAAPVDVGPSAAIALPSALGAAPVPPGKESGAPAPAHPTSRAAAASADVGPSVPAAGAKCSAAAPCLDAPGVAATPADVGPSVAATLPSASGAALAPPGTEPRARAPALPASARPAAAEPSAACAPLAASDAAAALPEAQPSAAASLLAMPAAAAPQAGVDDAANATHSTEAVSQPAAAVRTTQSTLPAVQVFSSAFFPWPHGVEFAGLARQPRESLLLIFAAAADAVKTKWPLVMYQARKDSGTRPSQGSSDRIITALQAAHNAAGKRAAAAQALEDGVANTVAAADASASAAADRVAAGGVVLGGMTHPISPELLEAAFTAARTSGDVHHRNAAAAKNTPRQISIGGVKVSTVDLLDCIFDKGGWEKINASPDSKLSVLKRLNCVTGEAQLESSKSALTSLTTQVRKYLCNTGVLMWLQRHFDVTAERALNGESIDVGAHMSNAERSAPLFAHYGPPPAPAELPALPASGLLPPRPSGPPAVARRSIAPVSASVADSPPRMAMSPPSTSRKRPRDPATSSTSQQQVPRAPADSAPASSDFVPLQSPPRRTRITTDSAACGRVRLRKQAAPGLPAFEHRHEQQSPASAAGELPSSRHRPDELLRSGPRPAPADKRAVHLMRDASAVKVSTWLCFSLVVQKHSNTPERGALGAAHEACWYKLGGDMLPPHGGAFRDAAIVCAEIGAGPLDQCTTSPITVVECMNGLSKKVDQELLRTGVPAEAAYESLVWLRDQKAFENGLDTGMLSALLTRNTFMQHWEEASRCL